MSEFVLIKSQDGMLDCDRFRTAEAAVRAARTWALGIYKDAELPETDDEDELVEAMMEADLPLDVSVVEFDHTREQKIAAIVDAFIQKQRISCPETIGQSDWVIENAYGFIEKLCDAAGYYVYPEDE